MRIDKIKLPDNLNLRRKLTNSQKKLIKEEYKQGKISQRDLAKRYGVSRRTIQFAIYPERYELAKQRRRRAWSDGKYREYYNKDKHREAMRSIRKRKKTIQT